MRQTDGESSGDRQRDTHLDSEGGGELRLCPPLDDDEAEILGRSAGEDTEDGGLRRPRQIQVQPLQADPWHLAEEGAHRAPGGAAPGEHRGISGFWGAPSTLLDRFPWGLGCWQSLVPSGGGCQQGGPPVTPHYKGNKGWGDQPLAQGDKMRGTPGTE